MPDRLPPDTFIVDENGETHLYHLLRDEAGRPVGCAYYGKVTGSAAWERVTAPPPSDVPPDTPAAWVAAAKPGR